MKIQNLCAKTKIDENDIQLLSDEELNVSKHVIEENLRVVKAAQYLKDNKAEEFGKLMTESHISLSRHYRVSTDNLNKISTSTLNQKAVRPLKTGFILDKSINELGYTPHSFEECLALMDEQIKQ